MKRWICFREPCSSLQKGTFCAIKGKNHEKNYRDHHSLQCHYRGQGLQRWRYWSLASPARLQRHRLSLRDISWRQHTRRQIEAPDWRTLQRSQYYQYRHLLYRRSVNKRQAQGHSDGSTKSLASCTRRTAAGRVPSRHRSRSQRVRRQSLSLLRRSERIRLKTLNSC